MSKKDFSKSSPHKIAQRIILNEIIFFLLPIWVLFIVQGIYLNDWESFFMNQTWATSAAIISGLLVAKIFTTKIRVDLKHHWASQTYGFNLILSSLLFTTITIMILSLNTVQNEFQYCFIKFSQVSLFSLSIISYYSIGKGLEEEILINKEK